MRKFWPNSNYQFLSVNQDQQLIITDDFLRSYLTRLELALIPESCAQEQKVHQLLTDNPRARIDSAEIKKMQALLKQGLRRFYSECKKSPFLKMVTSCQPIK
jgi:hypothetical protein